MKKFITMLFAGLLIMTASFSCTNYEKGLEKMRGTEVKNVTVKTLDITGDFYNYTQVGDSLQRELNKRNYELSTANINFEFSSNGYERTKDSPYLQDMAEDYQQEMKEQVKIIEELLPKVKSLSETTEKYLAENENGTVYVARFTEKNKFNKWNNYNSYAIFTINEDGSFYACETDEALKMVLSVFPKDAQKIKETIGNALIDAFSELGD